MRVLIDYRAALRDRSGVGEYTHQLIRALLKGCASERMNASTAAVTLFSSSWKDRLPTDSDLQGAASVDRRIPVRILNLAWHRLEWPPIEQLARGSFDVAHSLHPLLMPARQAAQVITIHDLNFLTHPERTRAEVRRDYAALARTHARRADAIVVVSEFTAGEVESRLGVPRDRMHVCSPGAPAWSPRSAPPSDGYILFFGTLEPRKNVGALLDAYETLVASRRDIPPLVLAGKATEQSGPWLERLSHAPLHGRVRHLGYVEPEKRRQLYEGARLLVQPSFEEGFGLTVLEAMTVGVPVVAANRGALPEVLGGAGVLVDPADREQLASAISQVIDDSALGARMSAAGITRASTYSWEATAQHTVAAYEAAVARRRSGGRSSHRPSHRTGHPVSPRDRTGIA